MIPVLLPNCKWNVSCTCIWHMHTIWILRPEIKAILNVIEYIYYFAIINNAITSYRYTLCFNIRNQHVYNKPTPCYHDAYDYVNKENASNDCAKDVQSANANKKAEGWMVPDMLLIDMHKTIKDLSM